MAELANTERLQPSLLDRLTDDNPRKTKESRERRAVGLRELRETVLRDIGWLLNTPNFERLADLETNREVASSVLNYGVPDITGRTSSNLDVRNIESAVREAIQTFEPRLIRESVRVNVLLDEGQMNHNAMAMEIEGLLWAVPVPIELYLKTDFDLESGAVKVTERSGPR